MAALNMKPRPQFSPHYAVLACFWTALASAAEPWKTWISLDEFKTACVTSSSRVDLFQAIWKKDTKAKLYGGTSRDFAWYVRGKLSGARSAEDARERLEALAQNPIPIGEVVVGESDVDVVSQTDFSDLELESAILTRIEAIPPETFKAGSRDYAREKAQGYLPVEKILLGKRGVDSPEGLEYGDGLREIYDARPTLVFNPAIVETDYYQARTNHPILLVLRYARQVAITYYRLHGKRHPSEKALRTILDPSSVAAVSQIVDDLAAEPAALDAFLANPLFKKRLARQLKKAFRSYTNPTAAKMVLERFGVEALLVHYGKRIPPYHTLLYTKYRNDADLERHRAQLGLDSHRYLGRIGKIIFTTARASWKRTARFFFRETSLRKGERRETASMSWMNAPRASRKIGKVKTRWSYS